MPGRPVVFAALGSSRADALETAPDRAWTEEDRDQVHRVRGRALPCDARVPLAPRDVDARVEPRLRTHRTHRGPRCRRRCSGSRSVPRGASRVCYTSSSRARRSCSTAHIRVLGIVGTLRRVSLEPHALGALFDAFDSSVRWRHRATRFQVPRDATSAERGIFSRALTWSRTASTSSPRSDRNGESTIGEWGEHWKHEKNGKR